MNTQKRKSDMNADQLMLCASDQSLFTLERCPGARSNVWIGSGRNTAKQVFISKTAMGGDQTLEYTVDPRDGSAEVHAAMWKP